jgi:hypothetical protein
MYKIEKVSSGIYQLFENVITPVEKTLIRVYTEVDTKNSFALVDYCKELEVIDICGNTVDKNPIELHSNSIQISF